jgi:phytol kinase
MIPWWQQIFWLALWVGGVLGIAQLLAQRGTADEYVRKFVHIGTGNIILLAWALKTPLWLALGFGIVFSAVTLLSYQVNILSSINGVNRKSWGTFFYALSITLLIGIFWSRSEPLIAALGILIMTWGDAFAALVGQTWGRRSYQVFGVKKTLEGSLAMGLVSFVVCILLLGFAYGIRVEVLGCAMLLATTATALETLSVAGIDNLTVPLGSAILGSWLIHHFLV